MNHSFGNVTSTIFSPSGTPTETSSNSLLNKQINTTQQKKLWLKHHVKKRLSWTTISTRAKDPTESVLDMRTHFKPTETFQYTFFTTCHPPGVKKAFVRVETLRPLRTNSSKGTLFEGYERVQNTTTGERIYPNNFINNALREVKLPKKKQHKKTNLALRYTIPPSSSKS